jgi:hypothetical protein
MANFPFTVGDSLRIGSATISASGNAVVLPTGTQVGNQNVATTVEVSTGGGPKITNLQVTSNVYVVLDDTAVDLTGGFIKITGTNFVSGCMVYVASTPAGYFNGYISDLRVTRGYARYTGNFTAPTAPARLK